MPGTVRTPSDVGCYHVVARGVGRQLIFESDAERWGILRLLKSSCDIASVSLIAWCLMDNHVHLLLEGDLKVVSSTMHRVFTSFALRHNGSTEHVGHVFQDRFKSQPIKDERHLLAVVRYIHNNPEKAGICPAQEYRWSSYHEYVGRAEFTDTELVLRIVGGVDGFKEFSAAGDAMEHGFEGVVASRLSSEALLGEIAHVLGPEGMADLRGDSRTRRDAAIAQLGELGLSVRQIERATGIGRYIIWKAMPKKQTDDQASIW